MTSPPEKDEYLPIAELLLKAYTLYLGRYLSEYVEISSRLWLSHDMWHYDNTPKK